MKKLLLITGCIALLSIFINARTQAIPPLPASIPQDSQTESVSVPPETSSDEPPYLLKEYDKRIAVFERDKETPLYVSEVYVSELPKADRRLLQNGIPAQSKKELTRLIEDYCN